MAFSELDYNVLIAEKQKFKYEAKKYRITKFQINLAFNQAVILLHSLHLQSLIISTITIIRISRTTTKSAMPPRFLNNGLFLIAFRPNLAAISSLSIAFNVTIPFIA